MKYIMCYENFSNIGDSLHKAQTDMNYRLIFESLVEGLSSEKKKILVNEFGHLNESWWSDLSDKASRGVLKIRTDAGQLLNDLAKKANDLLNFANQLSKKISEYIQKQFGELKTKVTNYALKDSGFGQIFLDYIKNKKLNKLKTYIDTTEELLKYIFSGQMIEDLGTRLSECFSNVLRMKTNEGLEHIFEADETEEKKSFLQKLGEKIREYPPFTRIPKIEEMMKKGISFISKTIDKFFSWLMTGKESILGSKFSKSFIFLFQILELYVQYKVMNNIQKFKDFLNKSNGLDDITSKIQDKSLDQVWDLIGINGEEVVNNIKDAVKKIPYIGDMLSVFDSLVISIGTYLSIQPKLKLFT